MTNRFMMSVAAVALIAGTGLANAQGTGMSREGTSTGSTIQQSAPSAFTPDLGEPAELRAGGKDRALVRHEGDAVRKDATQCGQERAREDTYARPEVEQQELGE